MKESRIIQRQSLNGKILNEKNSRIGGTKMTTIKAKIETRQAPNNIGFRGESLLNSE